VFSPKSLLRHPGVASPLKDFTTGGFREVIADTYVTNKSVRKVLLCSGKVYFDLLEEQQKKKIKDVAITRLEQLHPFPKKQLDAVLKKYGSPEIVWVQEEPENMGGWSYMLRIFSQGIKRISRRAAASPATGFAKVHKQEQEEIVREAFK
jgi:2-oxoglutarate dehydrogenase E1 component